MNLSQAKIIVATVWEARQTGDPAAIGAADDLVELVGRGMLTTWEAGGRHFYQVTDAGKEFIGAQKYVAKFEKFRR